MRRALGRYELGEAFAHGGMATVHLAQERGAPAVLALKVLSPNLAADPDFVAMFVDEARLAMQIHDPHVVSPVDVVVAREEVALAFPYVHGESLARLLRNDITRREPPPIDVVSAVVSGVLRGLAAAHSASDSRGVGLGIVHRDVSPENVLVGADGIARLIDFGVAKANARLQKSVAGGVKGKLAYMAPEILRGAEPSVRSDVYSTGVVLWEALTARRLFSAPTEGAIVERVLVGLIDPPSLGRDGIGEALDAVVTRALSSDPQARFATAAEMMQALEAAAPPAPTDAVAAWVERVAKPQLDARRARIEEMTGARKRRRPAGAMIVIGAGVMAVAAGALASSVAFRPKAATVEPQAATPSAEGVPLAELREPAPEPAAASVPPPPAAATTAPTTRSRSAAPTSPRRDSKAKRADCNIPYFLDGQGRRVFRSECL